MGAMSTGDLSLSKHDSVRGLTAELQSSIWIGVHMFRLLSIAAIAILVMSCAKTDRPTCLGQGRYQLGKGAPGEEREPVSCCAGLKEVEMMTPGYDVSPKGDRKSCGPAPGHREFACVAGTCGDGVCEPGESNPCGCPADCPDAKWEEAPR